MLLFGIQYSVFSIQYSVFGVMSGRKIRVLPVVLTGIYFGVVARAGGASEERVFRDTDGREIVAKILSATGTTVTIEMAGGKSYNLPIEKFSVPDQAFVKDWLEKNPPAFDYRLKMVDDRTRTDRSEERSGAETITTETWRFDLNLSNTSGVDLKGIEVRYRIFLSHPIRGQGRDRTGSTTDGALVLGNLPNNRDITGSTKEFTITANELDGGYYWTDGSKDKLEEKIEGIFVKVFHRGQNVLEYRSGNSDVKTASWTDEQALGLKAGAE